MVRDLRVYDSDNRCPDKLAVLLSHDAAQLHLCEVLQEIPSGDQQDFRVVRDRYFSWLDPDYDCRPCRLRLDEWGFVQDVLVLLEERWQRSGWNSPDNFYKPVSAVLEPFSVLLLSCLCPHEWKSDWFVLQTFRRHQLFLLTQGWWSAIELFEVGLSQGYQVESLSYSRGRHCLGLERQI